MATSTLEFQVVENWQQAPPEQFSHRDVAAVGVDSRDRVYLHTRHGDRVLVYDRDGTFLHAWGDGVFGNAHGITIGPDDAVYCTDDRDHTVRKFTPDGRLLLTLGVSGRPSDTGAIDNDYRTIQRAGPPFNLPTNLALSPDGGMYVPDGYGNARVHKFSGEGRLLFSWGEAGSGPGQFHLPHGIALDREGTVYVADRENSRVQLFTSAGEFLDEWTDVARPTQIFIDAGSNVYVSELGWRAGLFPRMRPAGPEAAGGRVSVFNRRGELQARWGGGDRPCEAGDFFAPHDVWADSRSDLYVSEVIMSAGGSRGLVPRDCHTLQKFVRL
jgi:DNA-binding beta-propeller fold protein YncE